MKPYSSFSNVDKNWLSHMFFCLEALVISFLLSQVFACVEFLNRLIGLVE